MKINFIIFRYAHHIEGAGSVIQLADPPNIDLVSTTAVVS